MVVISTPAAASREIAAAPVLSLYMWVPVAVLALPGLLTRAGDLLQLAA